MTKKKENRNTGFGDRVRLLRSKKGITQVELAKRLNITQRGISYYENETSNPSMEIIEKIAKALGVAKISLVEYDSDDIEEPPKMIRSLQKVIPLVGLLPSEEQQYLAKTIKMLTEKYDITEE